MTNAREQPVMPAEWSPHEATWLGWPHNEDDWPGKLAAIHWVYGEIVRKLTPHERVRLLVHDDATEAKAREVLRRVGADVSQVDFLKWPSNRGWMRDAGPIFVKRGDEQAIIRFAFNAWAKYDNYDLDAQFPQRAAEQFGYPTIDVRPIVLEGGAIDVNGQGAVLTTEECLLDQKTQVRNPGFSRTDVEKVFADYLGATKTIWLNKGIVGDDTHGHVDDICRFVDEKTIVLAEQREVDDPNHAICEENRERLEDEPFEVVRIPMPEPLYLDGQRLPASYANFYIGNGVVLVPTFNDPADREALGLLGELFRGREVVGIHAVDLVWGLGTLHCLTQQEPAPFARGRAHGAAS